MAKDKMELTPEAVKRKFGLPKAFYEKKESDRKAYESNWVEAASVTIPYIYPSTTGGHVNFTTPYSAIGGIAVNSLAAKLLLALLPPTGVFFRLFPDKTIDMSSLSGDEVLALEKELGDMEKKVVEAINTQSIRVGAFEILKYLIVTGNSAFYKVPNGGIKVFSPRQFVVERDYVGDLLTAVIKEEIGWEVLSESVREQLMAAGEGSKGTEGNAPSDENTKDIYTFILRESPEYFIVYQTVEDVILEDTIKRYSIDVMPYHFLRWTALPDSDYSIGIVEQYLGDFKSLNGLTQTIVEGAGTSAMTLFGVRQGSSIDPKELNEAANGQFVMGDLEADISVLRVGKGGDYTQAAGLIDKLEMRLSKAFMLLSGNIRDSERTTASEVRAVATELETTLGGVYSVLAAEFQLPLVRLLLSELDKDVLKVANPLITTGLSAISRERDFQNLNVLMNTIQALPPDVIVQDVNFSGLLSRLTTSLGMDPEGIIRSADEKKQLIEQQQQQQQQQAQQQMISDTVPGVAQEATKGLIQKGG